MCVFGSGPNLPVVVGTMSPLNVQPLGGSHRCLGRISIPEVSGGLRREPLGEEAEVTQKRLVDGNGGGKAEE